SSRRRHTRWPRDWSSDVCSSDLCYGYQWIQTPTIDQLAKQGIRFAQAFTPSPITNTSHASILTGLLPSSHGVSDFGVPLTADHSTLRNYSRSEAIKRRHLLDPSF